MRYLVTARVHPGKEADLRKAIEDGTLGLGKCRDLDGSEPWACCDCDCTEKLEERMEGWGRPFLEVLREAG